MERPETRQREPIESRWHTRKKRNADYIVGNAEFPRYDSTARAIIEGSIAYEDWAPWDKLFKTFQAMDRPNLLPLLRDNVLDDAATKLEGLFMADGAGFNRMRALFADDAHRKAWDMFYELMRKRAGSLLLSLARGGMLFEGLQLRGMRLAEIPEFTSCADADMREAIITGHVKNIDWSFADLRHAHFDQTFFVQHHVFTGARLEGAEFIDCKGLYFDPDHLPVWAKESIR